MDASFRDRCKKYYELAKPGIIYGNLLTAAAGFLFASGLEDRAGDGASSLGAFLGSSFDSVLFAALVIGTALVIGSACALNNYTDQAIDAKMERTKSRALVRGAISGRNALIYAVVLGCMGLGILFVYTNVLTACLELGGMFFYIVLYGLSKRQSAHGALVGSVSGAVAIVAGYAAVADKLDVPAMILFAILVIWQMPHFYAISLYRAGEYQAAGIPVLPVRKGIQRTKIEMLIYTILFFCAAVSLTILGYTGYIYLAFMGVISMIWILLAVHGFDPPVVGVEAVSKWGRKMFICSLVVIVAFSLMISVGALIS